MAPEKDTFLLGGREFSSRFILGSGKYSMELIQAAVEQAGAQIVTLAVRRTNTKKDENKKKEGEPFVGKSVFCRFK